MGCLQQMFHFGAVCPYWVVESVLSGRAAHRLSWFLYSLHITVVGFNKDQELQILFDAGLYRP